MSDEVLTRPEPSEELEPVLLDDDPEHLAYIGSKLAEDLKKPPYPFFKIKQRRLSMEASGHGRN